MKMDQWLANIYGTGAAEDLEKTAQATLLQKLAEEEGIDLSGLDEEQLAALADQVLADDGQEQVDEDGGQEQYADPVEQEQMLAKEAQAKFEEADFLGRVMAHAYTQELEKIGAVHGAGYKAIHHASKGVRAVGKAAKRTGNLLAGGGSKEYRPGNHPLASHKDRKVLKSNAREAMKSHGARAGAVAAAGAAGYGAKKALSKEASAFEKLAELRAAEILQAVGVDPTTGQPIQQQQEQQAPQFDEALNQRALEMLEQAGYDPNEIVGALNGDDGQGQDQQVQQ
jgi:hypothetical protein